MSLFTSLVQSFGELKSITRAPNGDIHVDFRHSEVADTVSSVVRCQLEVSELLLGLSCASSGQYCWCWKRLSILVYWQTNLK